MNRSLPGQPDLSVSDDDVPARIVAINIAASVRVNFFMRESLL